MGREFPDLVQYKFGPYDMGDFTDGGSTTGTLTITDALPAGAFPLMTAIEVHSAATATSATSFTLLAGVSGDTDAYLSSSDIATTGYRASIPTDPDSKLNTEADILLTATVAGSGAVFSTAAGGSFTLMANCILVPPTFAT